MKTILRVIGLLLPFSAMKDGAADPITLNNWWKVMQTKLNNFAQTRRPATINSPSLAAFLMSQRNRTAAQFDLNSVKISMEKRDGKKGYVGTVKWMPPLQMDDIECGTDDYCQTTGVSQGYEVFPYQINRVTRMKPVEVDDGFIRCLQEGKDEYVGEVMFNMTRAAVSAFAKQLEAEVYNLANNYIGKFPDRHQGTVSVDPGKVLNLFRDTTNAYNEINWVAESELEMDMGQAGVDEYVMFGGTIARHYAKLKQITVPNTTSGIDAGMLDAFDENEFFFDSYIESATEVTNPLMLLRPGALQLLTFAKNEGSFAYSDDAKHQRVTVVDPIFGLTWDLITNRVECGEDIKFTAFLELRWAVIGYPDCDDERDPLRVGVQDVFLYSIGCGDTPVCNLPADKQEANTCAEPYDNDCTIDEVCDPGCSLSLEGQLLGDGSYQVIAYPSPSLGATVESGGYAWELNAVGQATPATPFIISFASGAYANGDIVSLTTTDTKSCVATAQLVIAVPEVQVEADSNPTVDGVTLDLGSGPQATLKTTTVDIANIGALNPLTITGITPTGDYAGFIAPTLPANAPLSFDFDFDNTSTGLKSVMFTIATNDPNNPSYDLMLDFTYV
jgi:hypothetical protein